MPTTHAPDGTELYFADHGDGPPVILVHGITESHESWAPVTERLAATHRVIAMDLRGHGHPRMRRRTTWRRWPVT